MRESKSLLKFKKTLLVFAVTVLALGAAFTAAAPRQVQAAKKNGWVTKANGKTFYYINGKKLKGKWLNWEGNWYLLQTDGVLMTNNFRTTRNGYTYYVDGQGRRVYGWQKITDSNGNTDWYYFKKTKTATSGKMLKNKFKTDTKGKTYYVGSDGKRVYGWQEIKDSTGHNNWFYFKKTTKSTTGWMFTGLHYVGDYRYCFRTKKDKEGAKGAAMTGTATSRKVIDAPNGKQFLVAKYSKKGAFQTDFVVTNGKKRCYSPKVGLWINRWINYKGKYYAGKDGTVLTGWQEIGGNDYYFLPSGDEMGQAVVDKSYKIDGVTYKFDKDGVCTGVVGAAGSDLVAEPSSERTIKNFLLGALQPVGSTLYIWGGGHDDADAMRKGVNPKWSTFFNNHASKSYDYNNYRFDYGKGLDCSGYVGWSIYQVMETKSNQEWYTTVSGEVGDMAVKKGYGTTYTWSQLSGNFKPGDIGYDENHTWIVLAQCKVDDSLVILHSTPPGGVQIAGTPTPDGDYNSKAISLAKKYMKKFTKYYSVFGVSNTGNYARRGRYMRWRSTSKGLTDPDGYKSKSAAAILEDLFAGK